ncbi:MAG TPA: choice-of-anchor tandem repeat GloVer-containing protein [Verrucomicrobiae bacterium]|nr:choice-of-anchor tandem repeat GloVer-containing protein [Verrucomicrobiae bacterium]
MKRCTLKVVSFLILLVLGLEWAPRAGAQGWVTDNPLIVPRWSHSATLLNDDTVLIAGGIIYNVDGNFANTNECEIYDPVAGSPSVTGSMNDNRDSFQATLLPDGQVLVSGGGGDSSSETYDPGSGTWINFASMNEERVDHIAVLLTNGQVLAAGGFDDNAGMDTNSAELYDPSTQVWTTTAPMPYVGDTFAAAVLTNGAVLVCGGSYNGIFYTNAAAIYHPASQTWSTVSPMHEGRSGHTATLLNNGRVLVEGGTGDQSAEIFDPISQTWTLVASMNDGRYQCDAVLMTNGEVMVTGDGNSDVELYDPVHDVWTFTNSLPVAGNHQTETLLADGSVLVTGGSVSQFNGPPESVIETFSFGASSPPPASIVVSDSPISGLVPLAVQFTSPSTDSAGNPVTWNWNFGDGFSSTSQNPLHTYTAAGFYTPSVSVTDSVTENAVSVSGLQSVNVTNDAITVSVTPIAGAVPLSVQFTSPSVDSLGDAITNWSWSFGDGSNSTAQSPEHIYNTVGNFSPSLVAISTHSSTPLGVNGLSQVTVTNTPNPNFRVLYSLPTNSSPNGGLALANGVLYGTETYGGTVFAIGTNGSGFTNLNSSLGRPNGGLVLSGATLYGSSYLGGTNGGGAIFAINTNGTGFTNLYSFPLGAPTVGQNPDAGVIQVGDLLYGTTQFGGNVSSGVVFALTTNGTGISDQYSFSSAANDDRINGDGDGPLAKVTFANGVLYGTTEAGGTSGDGVVFSVGTNNPGSFAVLHYFSSSANFQGTNFDGAFPFAGLLLVGNTLYGTAAFGGLYGNGSVFAVNTDGTGFTNLYSFTGGNDGSEPFGEVILSGGTLYGTTMDGGVGGDGVLYSVSTNGTGFRTLYAFTGGNDGANPKGALTLGGNVLYGATTTGGAGVNAGAIFSYTLPVVVPVTLSIARSGTNVILTWPTNASGYTLQSSVQLGAAASWSNVSPAAVVVGGLEAVTNRISGSRGFYRLSQ